jgi:hypothetical protein
MFSPAFLLSVPVGALAVCLSVYPLISGFPPGLQPVVGVENISVILHPLLETLAGSAVIAAVLADSNIALLLTMLKEKDDELTKLRAENDDLKQKLRDGVPARKRIVDLDSDDMEREGS